MEYKTILVHVDASERTPEQIRIAAALAQKFNAHLIGAAVTGISSQFFMPSAMGENNLPLFNAALGQ